MKKNHLIFHPKVDCVVSKNSIQRLNEFRKKANERFDLKIKKHPKNIEGENSICV